jgi:predicted nucleotidyltransferase
MKFVGIVAEFNPLHRGHAYCLDEALRRSGLDGALVVLSSSFVQRGTPALLDRRDRAEAALRAGADLVFEIPLVYSCASSGVFTAAATDLLAATGLISTLAFGEETPGPESETIARILVDEPIPFKQELKKYLSEGYSFVEARGLALESLIPGGRAFLKKPNNSLSVGYRRRILQRGYAWEILPIRRAGADYHDPAPAPMASAAAVRQLLADGRKEEALELLPQFSRRIVERAAAAGRLSIDPAPLDRLLLGLLLRASPEELENLPEMREGLHRRILSLARRASSAEEVLEGCVSRRYPRGRIRRYLAHLLLGLDHWTFRACQRLGPPYLRLLGATERGRRALRDSEETRTLPLYRRAGALPSVQARRVAEFDFRGAAIWETLVPGGDIRSARHLAPILLP